MSMAGFKHYEIDETSARERHLDTQKHFYKAKKCHPINEMTTVQKYRFILLMHIAEGSKRPCSWLFVMS